ncbi:hypothetical protein AURDEDRAFT_124879 [Auricularia subglabra TFB-10046 SS5]|nr:hypothetical protein AURDEDRAFT_124879 [Auricularia subglabra TFB-10046 SS5]
MFGNLPPYDEHLTHLARQLQYLDCGEHKLPPSSTVFPRINHLRIAVSSRDKKALEHVFSQFPSVATLSIYRNFAEFPALPAWHPLQRLEICAKPDMHPEGPPDLSWAELRALEFLRVSELEIRDFTFSVLPEASRDTAWSARSVRIDAGGFFDATFVAGAQKCSMFGLTIRNSDHKLEALKLMYRSAFWGSVSDLTLSAINPLRGQPAPLLLPIVRTPQLTTLTIIVEMPAPNRAMLNWVDSHTTLLDAEHQIMSAEGELPHDVSAGLAQLVRQALGNPAACSSTALLANISSLRRCVENAISANITAHNVCASGFHLPDDVWSLVWEYLPLEDLLSASRVCRTWRAVALANSRLWAQLSLHARDGWDPRCVCRYPGEPRTIVTISNLQLLRQILPRSRSHTVSLYARIDYLHPDVAPVFLAGFLDFLRVVSPRLGVFHMHCEDQFFPGTTFDNALQFPALRELNLSLPTPECANSGPGGGDGYGISFDRASFPMLSRLALHPEFRPLCHVPCPELRILVCTVDELRNITGPLLSACTLDCLICRCDDGSDDLTTNPALLSALHCIPDVKITVWFAQDIVGRFFDILGDSRSQRLAIHFVRIDCVDEDSFTPRACRRVASATHLTVRHSMEDCNESIIIMLEDESGRTTNIVLDDFYETPDPAVDWCLIASFDHLASLRVDAPVRLHVMCNFPVCPQLSDVTLVLHTSDDLDDFIAADWVFPVPNNARLTLSSDTAISVSLDRLDVFKSMVGTADIVMDGVSVTECLVAILYRPPSP